MKRSPIVVLLALAACARTPLQPPRLFPLSPVWQTPLEAPVASPLASDGARVFAVAAGRGLLALDSGTGALVWSEPGLEGQLAATREALYLLQPDGALLRLDPLNGRRRWRVATGIAAGGAPLVSGERVLVVGHGAAAFEALAGRQLWSATDGEPAVAPAAVGDGRLLVTEQGGRLHCRDLESGRSLWVRELGAELQAGPAIDARGRVFIGTLQRRFLSLDARREGRTRWRWPVATDVLHGAVALRDRVLFASLENVLYALKSSSGDMLWRRALPSRPLAAPTLVGSALVLATQEGHLLGFNPETGAALGSLRLESEIAEAPIAVGDRFVAALRTRAVAAVAITGPPPSATPEP